MEVRKNFKLLEHEHIIYHFKAGDLEIPNIYNLFREKFKFRGFTKAFKNFAKYIAFIFSKFKYFAKQIIYLEFADHPLPNDIQYVGVLRV